jgi:hypothetical protein
MTRARNTRLLLDAGEELASVSRFTRGARRRGQNRVDLTSLSQALELHQCLERRVHCICRQRLAVEAAGAEPDHGLLAIDDLEGEVFAHAHHEHMNGVRADVDGGYSHGG